MNETVFSSKVKKIGIIVGVIFAVYNILIFTLCGGSEHGSSFWLSYVFMNIAMIAVAVCGFLLKDKKLEPRDWMLGYPFYRHCVLYLLIEFVASVLFMALDKKTVTWSISFAVQLIILAAFIIVITSCFLAKEMIEEVKAEVKVNTSFMKLFLVDVETVVERAENPEIKKAFSELYEEVKYSDPVSNELLSDLENKLAAQIDEAKACLSCNDETGAMESCKKAMLLLSERNRKCKALK